MKGKIGTQLILIFSNRFLSRSSFSFAVICFQNYRSCPRDKIRMISETDHNSQDDEINKSLTKLRRLLFLFYFLTIPVYNWRYSIRRAIFGVVSVVWSQRSPRYKHNRYREKHRVSYNQAKSSANVLKRSR